MVGNSLYTWKFRYHCLSVYVVCCLGSGTCHAQCLRNAAKPVGRWSHVACSVCCIHDKDGDGFLTEKDVELTYEMYCGDDRDEQESVSVVINGNDW